MTIYETLGVSPTVSDEELRAAYLAAARQLHPDRNPDPSAQAELARLNTAWRSVNHPARRAAHDLRIEADRRERLRQARLRAQAQLERESAGEVSRALPDQGREAQAEIEAALAAARARESSPAAGPPRPRKTAAERRAARRKTAEVVLDVLGAFFTGGE